MCVCVCAGISNEIHDHAGPKTQKYEEILKDSPAKHSLRRVGLRLEPIPPLDVVWNGDVGGGRGTPGEAREGETEEEAVGYRGFLPGPNEGRSLKRDGNVIPLHHQRAPGPEQQQQRNRTHQRGFR